MFRLLLTFLFLYSSQAWAVTQWNKALPSSGDNLTSWPAAVVSQWSILDTLFSNYQQGELLKYKNSTTITITSGQIVVSNTGASLRIFLSDSGNTDITSANLDSGGSFSNSTTYYVYAATSSPTAASSTYYISLSSSAPTGPTYYAQLGSFITDGSGNITTLYNNQRTGQFNAWTAKTGGVTYQALTDGFLTGYASVGSGGAIEILTDSSSSPATVTSLCQGGVVGTKCSVFSPVKAGDYYSCTGTGATCTTEYFLSTK